MSDVQLVVFEKFLNAFKIGSSLVSHQNSTMLLQVQVPLCQLGLGRIGEDRS